MADEPDNLVLTILREMRGEMLELRGEMVELRGEIGVLRREMDARFAAVNERLDAVEERVDDVKDISTTALWYVAKIYAERDDEKTAMRALAERVSAIEAETDGAPSA